MKNLIYSFGIILLFIIITACQKNNELAEELENPALNPLESTLRICHLDDDSVWHNIMIDESSWQAHEGHGDVLYVEFPEVGVFKWAYAYGDSTVMRTMYVTEVTETTFSGYGIDNEDSREWTIVDGTIYEDESFSYTIDYNNSDDYIECDGAYICGLGITGAFGTDGTLTGQFYGNFTEEDELIEINP
jgi:hypothetical protein